MHPMMRRQFLSEKGLWYDEHIRFGEDFLLYTQCLIHNARWWILPEAMYLYSVREDTLTSVQTPHDLDRIRSVETDLFASRILRPIGNLRAPYAGISAPSTAVTIIGPLPMR